MAKAPVAGAVKTRLCPPFDPGEAAALAAAFASDTWASAAAVPGAFAVLARAGEHSDFPAELAAAPSFAQRGDDLGARIEHAIAEGLARASRVLVIGSDLPGLPVEHLEAARVALDRSDAVLGASSDGGFYLIGVNASMPNLLAGLPWSAPNTRAATRARLAARGYRVVEVASYDDVDDVEDLRRLWRAIERGALTAPATAAVLSELSWC